MHCWWWLRGALGPRWLSLLAVCGSRVPGVLVRFFFFLNDPAPPEISPLSLPDALPICPSSPLFNFGSNGQFTTQGFSYQSNMTPGRSEEHTSELQSLRHLVCRLLL